MANYSRDKREWGQGTNRKGAKGFWRGQRGPQRGHEKSGIELTGKKTPAPVRYSESGNYKSQGQLQHPSPYKGWSLYFASEDYSPFSNHLKKIEAFQKYFISWECLFLEQNIEARGYFEVDFNDLVTDHVILESLPELASDLKDAPEATINCLGLGMYQMISASNKDPGHVVHVVHARIINYTDIVPLKNLRANYYGKFVAVKGTVIRVSNVKPLCTKMAFECSTCSSTVTVVLPDGKYTLPTACSNHECKGRNFTPQRGSKLTETIDWQTIRIQEIVGDNQTESGRIPRTVDCEITYDLVDTCVPGDIVTICGVVKVSSVEKSHPGKGPKDNTIYTLYVNANSITNSKGKNTRKYKSKNLAIDADFTSEELEAIEEIQKEPDLFKLIVASFCPSIYGHELVKAGLVLGVFGGRQKYINDKDCIPIRGDPHILVVGDPGLGKSQMLQSVTNIAPRSVYVCGNTTTTAGLTVTLSKEGKGSGDYALEAGALVLADQGCCCIDEFDKMSSQHQALLEAMEQQSISIAKAGIVCSLPARTSILAAANPTGGHYNKAKTVSENLKMGSALLSRFDLVFIMLDTPNEEMDDMLSEHVMCLHSGRTTPTSFMSLGNVQEKEKPSTAKSQSLKEKLKVHKGEVVDVIPSQLLRKYISYARKFVQPHITPQAAQVLQEFYLLLRKNYMTQDSTPITTRQLESLIRLTEARARLELRTQATESDAQDVINLMIYSMRDIYTNESGVLDFRRAQMGTGMSEKSQGKKFIAILQQISEKTNSALFSVQQIKKIAQDAKIQVKDFGAFIFSLNNEGFLLKKGPKVYQLQTSNF